MPFSVIAKAAMTPKKEIIRLNRQFMLYLKHHTSVLTQLSLKIALKPKGKIHPYTTTHKWMA